MHNSSRPTFEHSYLQAKGYIVSLLLLYKDGFVIQWFTKVVMPLNKETDKSNANIL